MIFAKGEREMDNAPKYLNEILGCNLVMMQKFMKQMPLSTQKLMQKVFGNNYDQAENIKKLAGMEKITYQPILRDLRKNFQKTDVTLETLIGCNHAILTDLLKNLNERAARIRVLKIIYGENLDGSADFTKISDADRRIFNSTISILQENYQKLYVDGKRVVANRPKSILEMLECNSDEFNLIKKTVLDFYPEAKAIWQKAHGENLSEKCDFSKFTTADVEKYNYWLNFSKEIIWKNTAKGKKPRRTAKTAKDLAVSRPLYLGEIIGYSQEKIADVVALCQEDTKSNKVLYQVHGPNLDQVQNFDNLDNQERKLYQYKIKALKKAIKDNKIIPSPSTHFLWERVGCSAEQIPALIINNSRETQTFEVLTKIHGPNLDQAHDLKCLTKAEKKLYFNFIIRLRQKNCDNLPKPKANGAQAYLWQIIGCAEEELIPLFNFCAQMDFTLLQKVHGQDFKSIQDLSKLSLTEQNFYVGQIKYLRRRKKEMQQKETGLKSPYLWEKLGCPAEDIPLLIANSHKDSAYVQVLYKVYGPNLDQEQNLLNLTPEERQQYYSEIYKLHKKYKDGYLERIVKRLNPPFLWEKLECSAEDIPYIIHNCQKGRGYEMLFKAHGANLDERYNGDNLTSAEKAQYRSKVNSLKKGFKYVSPRYKYKGRYLCEILDCSPETLKVLVNHPAFNPQTEYYHIMQLMFGPDFLGRADYSQVAGAVKTNVANGVKVLKQIKDQLSYLSAFKESEKLLPENPISPNQVLANIIAFLPLEYQKIMVLYLKQLPLNEIAKLMNKTEKEILESLEKIIHFLKEINDSYLKFFAQEIEPLNEIRKLNIY